MIELAAAAVRAGSRTSLGVIGLGLIAVAALALLLADKEDRRLRLRLLAIGLVGFGVFVGASYAALPPPLPTTDDRVILIDESNDYVVGRLPGGLCDLVSVRHMMRYRQGGSMWAPAGGPWYGVGWRIFVVETGRYHLDVRYSAETSHPAEIRLDEQTLFTGLGSTTGDRWKPQWFRQGTIELHAGTNRLAFYREDPLPWIDSVRLTRLADATPAQQPPSSTSPAR